MAFALEDLPIELLDLILQYLPLPDLLSFARTSKSNYELSVQALTTLDLAVFPRQIHSLLAFFDASNNDEDDRADEEDDDEEDPPVSKCWARRSQSDRTLHQIGLTTPKPARPSYSRSNTPPSIETLTTQQRDVLYRNPHSSRTPSSNPSSPTRSSTRPTPQMLRTAEITAQNIMATDVLETPSLGNLRTLTLRLYDLNSTCLASTIATSFPYLQSLSLEFSHPYIHDTVLPAKYWQETVPSGSPIWNILAGVGDEHASLLRVRSLRSLRLTRSGITSFQLRHWIAANPHLRELRLSLCRGVDAEFLAWLARYRRTRPGRNLETVHLIDCGLLELKNDASFAPLRTLLAPGHQSPSPTTIHDLSLRGCKSVDEDAFLRLANEVMDEPSASGTVRLVSPRGLIFRRRQCSPATSSSPRPAERSMSVSAHRTKARSVSPADDRSAVAGLSTKLEIDPRFR